MFVLKKGIPIEEWGTHEVALWLESINMAEYKSAFLRHDIRGTEIRNLDRRDLRVNNNSKFKFN